MRANGGGGGWREWGKREKGGVGVREGGGREVEEVREGGGRWRRWGGEGRGEGGGGARARRGSKVADAVFTSYIYRTLPFTKLFTENINLNVVMFLIYFIFKVTNSLQIKQCLITEESPAVSWDNTKKTR